ncbi:hypothetical protein ACS0TY_014262 [Phlomoides rotata]
MYKSRLQELCQKNKVGVPEYTTRNNGSSHVPRFTATVTVKGKVFETPEEFKSKKEAQNTAARIAFDQFNVPSPAEATEFFPTLKESEKAVAKVACQALSADLIQEDDGLYKNLLQEFTQKKGLPHPGYVTNRTGSCHSPLFVSVVAVGTNPPFRGAEANTKKQAEINAAKVAYSDLTKVVTSELGLHAHEKRAKTSPGDMNVLGLHAHEKRAKTSPGDMNVVPHPGQPSHDQTLENQPEQQ